MTRAYLALGANIGDRRANLLMALRWLAPHCRVVAVSSLYESKAMVLEGAAPAPDYLNAACAIETDLSPEDLLAHVKHIEHAIGRRPGARWAPRVIDIDILLYGDVAIATESLTIPHAGLPQRDFVLAPLAEIAGDAVHPALGRTVADLAADIEFAGLSYVEDASWAYTTKT